MSRICKDASVMIHRPIFEHVVRSSFNFSRILFRIYFDATYGKSNNFYRCKPVFKQRRKHDLFSTWSFARESDMTDVTKESVIFFTLDSLGSKAGRNEVITKIIIDARITTRHAASRVEMAIVRDCVELSLMSRT